ncbi:hypothetical protein [Pandoraea bronchicola]|uniref:hypothetical protein n=1 Tax=Pandoraea bronchicola TaxID=2508287 RepID=UPI0012411D44|nr:hypothetical protein [Pandoraea bronchicola]
MKEMLEKAFGESAILPLAHVSRHGLSAMQQRRPALARHRREILLAPTPSFPAVAHQSRAKDLIFSAIFA